LLYFSIFLFAILRFCHLKLLASSFARIAHLFFFILFYSFLFFFILFALWRNCMVTGYEIRGDLSGQRRALFSAGALRFLHALHEIFGTGCRRSFARGRRACGALLPETEWIRLLDYRVAAPPVDLRHRGMELSGSASALEIVRGLNSGADVFVARIGGGESPYWECVTDAHLNLQRAVSRSLEYRDPEGRVERINGNSATLVVRPRGWDGFEGNLRFDGEAMPAALFDFGLYFYHNVRELRACGSGAYFELAGVGTYLEARMWNQIFLFAQKYFGFPRGTIRASVVVESPDAALEMDEILYELREHASGLSGAYESFSGLAAICRRRGTQFFAPGLGMPPAG
jgi:malate synthase